MARFDLIIRGGEIVDGTGRGAFRADVGIDGDRITAVADLSAVAGVPEVDCPPGAVVAPGFIDVHNHADATILCYPRAENFLMQGTTTVVTGHCGYSAAPLVANWLFSFWEHDFWFDVEPFKYHEPLVQPLDKVRAAARDRIGLEIDWQGFGDWLARVERTRVSPNILPLVGHNTVRAQVMGRDFVRPPTADEISAMAGLIRRCMEEGAAGFSTGLDYQPGAHADTRELVEMAKVVRAFEGLHSTHWRRTGIRRAEFACRGIPGKLAGIQEALEISSTTGIPVLISHISPGFTIHPSPPEALDRAAAEATTALIDEAVEAGVNAAFDVIPNTSGGVLQSPFLAGVLTPWFREAGSPAALTRLLKMADFRDEVRRTLEDGRYWPFRPRTDPGWAARVRFLQARDDSWVGHSVADLAKRRGRDQLETLFELTAEDPTARVGGPGRRPSAAKRVFTHHPRAMLGSDVFAFDDTWQAKHPPHYLPHENTYSAVPRYLEDYAPAGLEAAVHRLTGLPAGWLGLRGRGEVAEGNYADLVVFSPGKYRAKGDRLEPRKYPAGVHLVLVNGEVVVRDGVHSDARPGRVLRRG